MGVSQLPSAVNSRRRPPERHSAPSRLRAARDGVGGALRPGGAPPPLALSCRDAAGPVKLGPAVVVMSPMLVAFECVETAAVSSDYETLISGLE